MSDDPYSARYRSADPVPPHLTFRPRADPSSLETIRSWRNALFLKITRLSPILTLL